MKKPTWDETEEIIEDAPKWDDTEELLPDESVSLQPENDISMVETAALNAGQGLTMGILDELYGMFASSGGAGPSETIANPKLAAEKERKLAKSYIEETDKARDYIKKSKEQNPGTAITSEIIGGIIPAALSLGPSAAAQTVSALAGKAPMAKSLGKLATEGAKFGGLYGFGESEAEGLGEMAVDTASGALTGAIAAPTLSLGLKALGTGYGSLKKGASNLAEKVPTLTNPFKFAKKHGMTTSKERSSIMEDDIKGLIKKIKNTFEEIGASKEVAEEKAKQAQVTFDLTGDLKAIEETLREEAGALSGKAAKLLYNQADEVASMSLGNVKNAEKALMSKVEEEVKKKMDMSARKEAKAPIEAESKLIQHAIKSGDDLHMISEKDIPMGQMELPLDTKNGNIFKSKGKFKGEDGEYEKILTKDTTKFQPSDITIDSTGDEIVASFMNQATNEVFKKYGKKPPEGLNFQSMDIDALTKWVRSTGKIAFDKNNSDSDMYLELWKLGREKITDMLPLLSKNKAEQAKLFQIMEVLGIDKSAINRNISHSDMVKTINNMPGRLNKSKDYLERHLVEEGSDISKSLDDIKLGAETEGVLKGTTSSTGEFTEAGRGQKIAALSSEFLGSMYGKGERVASKLYTPVKAVTDVSTKILNKISPENLGKFRNYLTQKGTAGEVMADQIEGLVNANPETRDRIVYSLSQRPEFRKMLGNFIKEMDEDTNKSIGTEPSHLNNLLQGYNNYKNGRTPQSLVEDSISTNMSSIMDQSEDMVSGLPDKNNLPKSFFEKKENEPDAAQSNLLKQDTELKISEGYNTPENDTTNYVEGLENSNREPANEDPNYLNIASDLIKREENSIKKGFDKKTGLWKPHPSIEGGPDTLAYGTKLDRGNFSEEEIMRLKEGVTEDKAEELMLNRVKSDYKKLSDVAGDELSNFLSDNQIAALLSYWYNAGHIRHPNLEGALRRKDVQGIINNMDASTYTNEEGIRVKSKSLLERRNREKDLFNKTSKAIESHSKYIGSGGSALESSTGDRAMGYINELPISEDEKDEMNQAVADGDIVKLREMMNKYREMVG